MCDKDGLLSLWTYVTGFPLTRGIAGKMPSELRLSIHCLIGMNPLVVCRPPVGKEQASANQRPFHHSVRDNRGRTREGLSQSEAFPPLGAESAVVCYWRPI